MKVRFLITLFTALQLNTVAQIHYPYPTQSVTISTEGKTARMVYMDIQPATPSGKTVVLFHGKNFNGYYWKNVIQYLANSGLRVIVPDQIGWGKSDRPNLHYSFHMLADNTRQLLDTLGINKISVVGHSMGGMLAARFTLLYPERVEKLVMENPIGLEDYKTFVPYQPLDKIFTKEKQATLESYKKYQHSYYTVWKPEYDQYVDAQAADLASPDFQKIAWVNALTYQMIYEQPVLYELYKIAAPTLFIIGLSDRTVVGKDLLTDQQKLNHGQYQILGKRAANLIKGAKLLEMEGVGHIPHIQEAGRFNKILVEYLKQ